MNSGFLGNDFTKGSGIVSLMEDLGSAMGSASSTNGNFAFLGGGNPARIPAMEKRFQLEWNRISENSQKISQILGEYTSPLGDESFREAIAFFMSPILQADLKKENIAITAGSQSAFFSLLNFRKGKILLPLIPEYIGYADQSLGTDSFLAIPPIIQTTSSNSFRYTIDWDRLQTEIQSQPIALALVSRPTNPTGNMISHEDWIKLSDICKQNQIPLVMDNAYGFPFPGIVFQGGSISWSPDQIFVYSLSKFGLPGVRTGIVIASKEICSSIGDTNAILQLAVGNLGPSLALSLFQTGEILSLSQKVIQPFYAQKRETALQILHNSLQSHNVNYQIHESDGAFFFWLRFPGLYSQMGGSRVLYEKLKSHGVVVVPGDYFFLGQNAREGWLKEYSQECIRIQFAREEKEFQFGIDKLASVLGEI